MDLEVAIEDLQNDDVSDQRCLHHLLVAGRQGVPGVGGAAGGDLAHGAALPQPRHRGRVRRHLRRGQHHRQEVQQPTVMSPSLHCIVIIIRIKLQTQWQ